MIFLGVIWKPIETTKEWENVTAVLEEKAVQKD